jgi:hypothetical protein
LNTLKNAIYREALRHGGWRMNRFRNRSDLGVLGTRQIGPFFAPQHLQKVPLDQHIRQVQFGLYGTAVFVPNRR